MNRLKFNTYPKGHSKLSASKAMFVVSKSLLLKKRTPSKRIHDLYLL